MKEGLDKFSEREIEEFKQSRLFTDMIGDVDGEIEASRVILETAELEGVSKIQGYIKGLQFLRAWISDIEEFNTKPEEKEDSDDG